MTGSNLAAIVVPIVAMFSLAAWLAMVFYAASHLLWQNRTSAGQDEAPARYSREVRARSPHRRSLTHAAR